MRIAVAFAHEVVKGREAHLSAACAGVLSVAGAGLSIMSDHYSGRMCVSNSRMDALEEIQFTLGEGPCQDAYATGAPLLVPRLDQVASARWPAFIAEAAAVGVHAVFAYPLMNRGAKVGVMTLYQDEPGALSATQGADCLAVADVLAATMLGLIAASPPGTMPSVLDEAVAHREEVHQATGMLSAQLDISIADALVRLDAPTPTRRVSRFAPSPPRSWGAGFVSTRVTVHSGRIDDARRWPTFGCSRSAHRAHLRRALRLVDRRLRPHRAVDASCPRSVELLDAAAAGILLADSDRRFRVLAASSERLTLLELLQIQNDEGPSRADCFETGQLVVNTDLTAGSPWPMFAAESVRYGLPAVCAVPVRLKHVVLGCLNLFMTHPTDLSETDIALAQALAHVASIALLQTEATRDAASHQAQLQQALENRIVIEQAKGMLSERGQIDMDEAFSRLRNFARTSRRHVTEVAAAVVTGTLDTGTLIG